MSWPRRSILDQRLRQRVIVTLHSGESFVGVLWEADAAAWVLRNAEAIDPENRGQNVAVDGELVVLAENVAYAQRP